MSPESFESRLVRQEERHVALRSDFNNGMNAIREAITDSDKETAKQIEALEKSMTTQFKAIADKETENKRSRRAIYAALGLSLFGLVSNVVLQLIGLGGPHT